jgi:hypothetical protein
LLIYQQTCTFRATTDLGPSNPGGAEWKSGIGPSVPVELIGREPVLGSVGWMLGTVFCIGTCGKESAGFVATGLGGGSESTSLLIY